MPFQDGRVFDLIDQLGEYYSQNIDNAFLRPSFSRINISREDWERIAALANQSEYEKAQGYSFWELYEMILAMARFVSKARNELAPNIRAILSESSGGFGSAAPRGNDILKDMAISNFRANLDVLADKVHELYMRTALVDKESHKVKAPVYTRMPDLAGIGSLLVTK
ncbi:MAG: hypothetical protein JEY99_02205 [Spirochaetales bacterium]|nr:hypothetical protein [Spirochaetales bacterium]